MTDCLVVDASVVVKWYLPEEGSRRAQRLLEAGHHLIAPDLLIAEVGNVLWKRRRVLPAHEGQAIVSALVNSCPVSLYLSIELLEGAMTLALTYERTVYDSLYLALAVAQECELVSGDKRFCNAMQNTALRPYVRSL